MDPIENPASVWASDEFLPTLLVGTNISPQDHLLRMPLRPDLVFRKIYLYVEPAFSVAAHRDFYLDAELCLWVNGAVQERIPASDGQDVNQTLLKGKSKFGISCCAASSASSTPPQAAAPDALKVVLSSKFVNGVADTIILNPHKIISPCDQISYSLRGVAVNGDTLVGVRVFLAVQSLNYSY